MNIVYTINGEGMGHATRSAVVIEHLLKQGHRVAIFSEGTRVVSFLRSRFKSVADVTGLHMVYQDNRVKRIKTIAKGLMRLTSIRRDLVRMRAALSSFKPQVVLTDFDFHGGLIARYFKIPLISIDNIQYITQAKLQIAAEDFVDYELSYLVAKMMVPRADFFFITTFGPTELRNGERSDKVKFVPPLLRQKILIAKSSTGRHVLVYQTSDSYRDLFAVLSRLRERFVVYNARPVKKIQNIVCKNFNEEGFIADIASAKAVVTNGGFTLISESLYLGKPVLSIPIKNHFEQKLNGQLLTEQGYGRAEERLTPAILREFLGGRDRYVRRLRGVKSGNGELFRLLDQTLTSFTEST